MTPSSWLHETYGTVVELYFAHGLCQSLASMKSTGFDVHQVGPVYPPWLDAPVSVRCFTPLHQRSTTPRAASPPSHTLTHPYTPSHPLYTPLQDTEDFPFIEYTVVVKLTADPPGHAHSAMRLVGAPRHFEYDAPAGSAGVFRARVFHASVEPAAGTSEHLKLAFFFRASTKGERRAKRGLGAAGGGAENLELAHRRQHVALELSNSNFEAQRLAAGKR